MTPEAFKRTLRNTEAMWRRLDRGELTGRNAVSSDRTRQGNYEVLREALRAELLDDQSPLYRMLDNEPRTAARWGRLERRSVGLPV